MKMVGRRGTSVLLTVIVYVLPKPEETEEIVAVAPGRATGAQSTLDSTTFEVAVPLVVHALSTPLVVVSYM